MVDPFGGDYQEPQSLHKYLYCHSDPINYTDPSGEFEFSAIGQVITSSIQNALRQAETFYKAQVSWRVGYYTYRAFNLYSWGLQQLPKIYLGLTALDVGLSFLDSATTAWLENSQPVPASTVDRGNMLHNISGSNLGRTFPMIDDFRNGAATSIKTHGLASRETLLNTIRNDLRGMERMKTPLVGKTASGESLSIEGWQIQTKCLLVAVPQNQAHWLCMQQFRDMIRNLQSQYKTVIRVVPVKGWKK